MSTNMKSPGQQLKEAREKLGRTQSDMARNTRISIQQLQGLEDDRYESIPAPMYVRGFMKLYAKELGINPDPLLVLYEKIRKGEPLTDEEPEVPTPAPASTPEPVEVKNTVASVSPEFGVEEGLASTSAPLWDWQAWSQKLPNFRNTFNPELLQKPKFRYAMIGLVAFCMLLVLRSCVKSRTTDTSTEQLPVVEPPLLSPPEPVYYQLPSSYQ